MITFIITISLLLDGLIPLYISANSIFLPLLTLTSLFAIYPLYKKNDKSYLFTIITTGIIYDLLYTNLLFFHAIIFYILGKLTQYIHKNYSQNIINTIIYLIIMIVSYESLTSVILYIFKVVPISFSKVFYKITHSILINVIYITIIYSLIKTQHTKHIKN